MPLETGLLVQRSAFAQRSNEDPRGSDVIVDINIDKTATVRALKDLSTKVKSYIGDA